MNYSRQIINQMSGRLDSYFTEIENLSLPMIARSATAQFLDRSNGGPYERLLVSKPVNKLIYSVMVSRPDIYGMSIVTQERISTSSYSNLYAQQRFKYILDHLSQPGKFEIIGVSRYNSIPLMTLAIKFFSQDTQNWGILIVDVRLNNAVGASSDIKLGDTGFAWIADRNGRYLYYPDQNEWGKPVPAAFLERLKAQDSGGFIERSNGMNTLVTYGTSSISHLTFFSEVPLAEINKDFVALRNITILIGIIVLTLSLVFALSVSFSLSNSILKLQRMMKRVENGYLDVQAPDMRKNEIGELYRSFNAMVKEIKNLIQTVDVFQIKEKESLLKQKDSQLQALQYQINPHFLYNTLEIINSHAIIEEMPVISRIVNSLARIFRYSVENHAKMVPLSVELEHIKDYLDIQLERFEKLRVELDMDEEQVSGVTGVPMMLQPLVENSFKHGYQKHKLESEFISISGKLNMDQYCIYVTDHGYGMDANDKEKYNSLFQSDPDKDLLDEYRLGLWNVHSRIRLFFGDRYGLRIVSSDQNGTVICISLPYRTTL